MTDNPRNARGRQVLFLSAVFSSYLLLPHPARAEGWNITTPPNIYCTTCNVGIGVSSPVFRLDLGGAPRLAFDPTPPSPDATRLLFGDGTGWKLQIAKRSDSGRTSFVTFQDNGNVGIGTANPTSKLHIYGNTGVDIRLEDAAVANAAWRILPQAGNSTKAFRIYDATAGLDRLYIDASGNVGIGTTSPQGLLHVRRSNFAQIKIQSDGPNDTSVDFQDTTRRWIMGINVGGAGQSNFNLYDAGASATRLTVNTSGDVGIGTTAPAAKLHVVGNATVSGSLAAGTFAATYQDLAEWVPARSRILPGTVVVIDRDRSGEVRAGSLPYDTGVAGVISARPGIVLGEEGEGKVMVATTGRVKVKVDASRGAVRVGDLLVTSEHEGMAMRSEPIVVAGTKIHRPGTLIGKALEPLPEGQGEILVLLSLQ